MYKDFMFTLTMIEKLSSGLFKNERIITSPQILLSIQIYKIKLLTYARITILVVIHPDVLRAAKESIDSHGFGMSSVRFICIQNIHKKLEESISQFLEQKIQYFMLQHLMQMRSFVPLFGPEDAIISDELNHASIIDGIRLRKVLGIGINTTI